MGCPLRIIVLVKGYWQGGRSPIRKAQNDVRLASNVGHRVTPGIVRCQLSFDSYRGSSSPLIEIGLWWFSPISIGERVELKDGWPTVKVPFVMVWGYVCSPLSLFLGPLAMGVGVGVHGA